MKKDYKGFGVKFEGQLVKCVYVFGNNAAKKSAKRLLQSPAKILGLDLETARADGFLHDPSAGLDPQRSTIRLAQIYDGVDTCYIFDMWHVDIEILRELLETRRFVAHNALFDLSHLTHNGIPNIECDCTMLMALLVSHATEIGGGYGFSLAELVRKKWGVSVGKLLQTSNWNAPELSMAQLQYAGLDSFFVVELVHDYIEKLKKFKLAKVYKLNRAAQHVVVGMQLAGIKMDQPRHQAMIKEWEDKRKDALRRVELFMPSVNPRSPKQMKEWLEENVDEETLNEWEKTDSGKYYKTDADTLRINADLEFIEPLATYKHYDKLCTTYGQFMYEKTSPVTNRLHPGYTLCRTHTGRMSSREPNIQNCPRGEDFKELFVAEKGKVFLCADYSQIELRVAAEISDDPIMKKAYTSSKDLYKIMAMAITHKPYAAIDKASRQVAKAIMLGLQFGMGPAKLTRYAHVNYGIKMSLEQAKEYVNTYHKLYEGYAAWKKKQAKICEDSLIVTTPTGKTRKLTEENYYACGLNTPIQGGAAEIMLYAMVGLHKAYQQELPCATIVSVIHDELLIEVENTKKSVEKASELLKREMQNAMKRVFPQATLRDLVEVGTGQTWAEAK